MPYITSRQHADNDIHIYYEVHGNLSGPTIVFHHGNGNCSAEWGPLGYMADDLMRQYNLVFIDMLGFGKSSKITDPKAYDPDLLARDTIAVLDTLKLTENLIFYGGSMGGQLGFTLAIHPEYSVRFKLFIINGATPYGTAEISPVLVKLLLPAKEVGMKVFMRGLEKELKCHFPEEIREIYAGNDVGAMIASNTIPWPDYSDKLPGIKPPFLLIVGGRDDILSKVKQCAAAMKNAEVVIFSGLDHVQTYWQGSLVVPIMLEYLQKKS